MRHASCINTAPGGVIEFTAHGSDVVLGKVEIDEHGITGEVTAPNVPDDKARADGVDAADQGRVHALAERLRGIRRCALAGQRWSLFESGLAFKDAARVVIRVQGAIEELCFTENK